MFDAPLEPTPLPADPLARWRATLGFAARHDALGYLRAWLREPAPAGRLFAELAHERRALLKQLAEVDLPASSSESVEAQLEAFFSAVQAEACRWSRLEQGEAVVWPYAPAISPLASPDPALGIFTTLSREVLGELDLKRLPGLLLAHAQALTGAEVAVLCLWSPESERFEVLGSRGLASEPPAALPPDAALMACLRTAGDAVAIAREAAPSLAAIAPSAGTWLVGPLRMQGELLGLIACAAPGAEPARGSLELLTLLANQTTIALRNGALYREVLGKAAALRDANERLRGLDRMKDQFLATVSHELRTPINFITGFGSILLAEESGSLSDEQRHFVEQMLEGAYQLLSLVNDLLDYSAMREGHLGLACEAVPIDRFLQEVVPTYHMLASAAEIGLRLVVREPLATCWVDPRRLGQVLANLITNALKFSPAGSQVVVTACGTPEGVRLAVVDAGRGVPADRQAAVFERFSQLETTRGAGGVGLGLVICKTLIEAHGGRIGVVSPPPPELAVQPGVGSCFWFELPAWSGR